LHKNALFLPKIFKKFLERGIAPPFALPPPYSKFLDSLLVNWFFSDGQFVTIYICPVYSCD